MIHSDIIQRSFRKHTENTLRSVRGQSENKQRTFREYSENTCLLAENTHVPRCDEVIFNLYKQMAIILVLKKNIS